MAQNMNPALVARFDEMLMTMTQQAGNGINGLLDTVFSFLQRRTDFFYEAEPGDKMGFPPQYAEGLIYQYFKKYQIEHQKKFPSKGEALSKRWDEYKKQAEKVAQLKKEQAEKPEEPKVQEVVEEEEKKEAPAAKPVSVAKPSQPSQPQKVIPAPKDVAKETRTDVVIDKSMNTYNGAKTSKYNWSQNISGVDVQIELPAGTTAKMLDVQIKVKSLRVAIKGQEKPIIEGELCEKVRLDDTFWTVEDKKYLTINFEKAYEAIWKSVLVGDEEIDTKTVDNSKRIEEFDLETQGHLQKVLYEQERKKMGLPTTEEEQQQKLMEKMMEKQGANNPMAGLPYDSKLYGQKAGSGGPSSPFAPQ